MAAIAGLFLALIIIGVVGLLIAIAVAFFTGVTDGSYKQYEYLCPDGNYRNGWIFPLSLVYDLGYSAYESSKDKQEINKKRFNRE